MAVTSVPQRGLRGRGGESGRIASLIGVEGGGHVISALQSPRDIGVGPARLGRRGDMAIAGGSGVDSNRPEARNADRVEPTPLVERFLDRRHRRFGIGRIDPAGLDDGRAILRQHAHALGSAELDTCYSHDAIPKIRSA